MKLFNEIKETPNMRSCSFLTLKEEKKQKGKVSDYFCHFSIVNNCIFLCGYWVSVDDAKTVN